MLFYCAYSVQQKRAHQDSMLRFEHRIHVNGIRGKSSVTRLIAASLREAGIKTAAKTTGSSARILIDHNYDVPVKRKEADIAEQRRMLRFYTGDAHRMYTGEDYKAVVFECMAINPIYQKYLEENIMNSTIGVITNIREDHTDMLGETLAEIATNLCNTIPFGGHLVTAETNPDLIDILKKECKRRSTALHVVGNTRIADKVMAKFGHFEYKPNVAIAIKVASLAGVDRATAIRGMHNAIPDPGSFALQKLTYKSKTIHWANLFAINDRESFVITVESLSAKIGKRTKKAVILNNRHDRPERVAQFVDIAVNAIRADYIFTFGDYETKVRQEVKKYPHSKVKVIHMGNSTSFKTANGETLFETIAKTVKQKNSILLGAVNIHTQQAETFLSALYEKGS